MNESWKELVELFDKFEITPEEVAEFTYSWLSDHGDSDNTDDIMKSMVTFIQKSFKY